MVIRVSNKNIHRYRYTKRKIRLKGKSAKKTNISFGDIFANIEMIKAEGLISVSNVNIRIANAIRKFN